MKKILLLLATCGTIAFGNGCSKDSVPVQTVSFDQNTLALDKGKTKRLTLKISPADASHDGIAWATSDPAIATIDNGTVTAVAAGTATVTATVAGQVASCVVTVSIPATDITLDKPTLELAVGDTGQLTATISPADATQTTITWESSDTAVATVDNGTVTAVAEGTATVTAKLSATLKAECVVTVKPAGKIWAVGDLYDVEGVKGVVVEISNEGLNGKIISMDQTVVLWASEYIIVGCVSEEDGKGNTQKAKDVNSSLSMLPAFKWCVDHGTGWYFPAIDEVYVFMKAKDTVNPTLTANQGTLIAGDYWTSTESENSEGESALYAYFSNGVPRSGGDFKTEPEGENNIRAMYAF